MAATEGSAHNLKAEAVKKTLRWSVFRPKGSNPAPAINLRKKEIYNNGLRGFFDVRKSALTKSMG